MEEIAAIRIGDSRGGHAILIESKQPRTGISPRMVHPVVLLGTGYRLPTSLCLSDIVVR